MFREGPTGRVEERETSNIGLRLDCANTGTGYSRQESKKIGCFSLLETCMCGLCHHREVGCATSMQEVAELKVAQDAN